MENVLQALKAMGKATAREISAHMKIDVKEILSMLREHEELEQIELVNGWWQLTDTGVKTPRVKPAVPAVKVANRKEGPVSPAAPARKINESVLAELMTQHGELTTEQMAKLAGTTVRAVASTLAMPVNRGRVVREKRGNVFHFTLAKPALAEPEPAVTSMPEIKQPAVQESVPQSDAAFLDAIPQMAKRQVAGMVCPTPKSIAAEIRRTKSRLNQLEELRITVRQLARQQRALGF